MTKWLLCGKILQDLTKGDKNMGVPTFVICFLIAGVVLFLIFTTAFVIESVSKNNDTNNIAGSKKKDEDLDIDAMLSRLESKAQVTPVFAKKEEPKPEVTPVVVPEKVEEPVVEPAKEEPDFDALFASLAVKDEPKQEVAVVEEKPEPKPESKFVKLETTTERTIHTVETPEPIVIEKEVYVGTEFDYESRYARLKDSLAKCEKDLAKSTKEVNKYEKTKKRKERNEKLLERKAGELTNLNLVLYNVNDIKQIDPEKKEKQENLSAHIAELKATIAEASEYLEANAEKYKNSLRIKEFLTGERERQLEEMQELEVLIAEAKKKNN